MTERSAIPCAHIVRFRVPIVAGLVLALASPYIEALSTDREEPILIEANAAEADNRERVTIYRGDVIITQGTLRITGDTVWIYYDEANNIEKLVSVGAPARFRQLPDGKQQYQNAKAKRMEYYTDEDTIVMTGDAHYGEGANRIAAERIVYDSRNGRMKAEAQAGSADAGSGDAEGGEGSRVRIRIVPKKKSQGSE